LLFNRSTFASGTASPCRSAVSREITGDALVDPLEAPLHLGLGEILVPRIDCLELRSVDGDARCTEQIKFAAQRESASPK
jgi:hypothetical protein